jgi:putative SOS response-associated peptidase YedK
MCGRAALTASPEDLRDAFELEEVPDIAPRYNIVPSQPIAVVRLPGRLELLRWGLVPFWAKDPAIGHKLALARTETAERAPAFRDAVRQRRCVVVVSGFYEWQRAGKKESRPFFARRADAKPLALAGVWDRWVSKDGEVVESCAILTRAARQPLDAVHDRMPLVLDGDTWKRWLQGIDVDGIVAANDPGATSALVTFPVDPYVNDPRHDDARCLEPAVGPVQRDLFR